MASASVLILEELSGPGRRLELVGPGLPFRGAEWPNEQRIVTTWYQGNGSATQHVLGHVDRPSSWSGVWNTTRLTSTPCKFFASSGATGQVVVDAFTLYEIVDSFEIAARELGVTWSAGQGLGIRDRTIRRVGRISKFEPKFDRADDIRWDLTFDWSGRGQATQTVAPARDEDLRASLAELSKVLGDVASSIELAKIRSSRFRIPSSASSFSLGDLEQLAAAPSMLVDDLARACRQIEAQADQAGALVSKVRQTPDALREQSFSIARGACGTMSRFQQSIGVVPVETLSSDDSRVAPALKGALYLGTAGEGAGKGAAAAGKAAKSSSRRGSAIEFDDKGRRVSSADVDRTRVSKQGETFASIAVAVYGSSSRAGDLARANGFPSYQVAPPAGTILVLPAFGAPAAPAAA